MFRIRKPEHVNAAIRDMARLLGIRNRDLARATAVFSEQQVGAWFRGARRMSPDTMVILADAMDCDVIIVPRGIHIGEHIPVPEPIGMGVFAPDRPVPTQQERGAIEAAAGRKLTDQEIEKRWRRTVES